MSLANLTDMATTLASDAKETSSKGLESVRTSLAASAKENRSKLRSSGSGALQRLSSGTELKRLAMRSDSSG